MVARHLAATFATSCGCALQSADGFIRLYRVCLWPPLSWPLSLSPVQAHVHCCRGAARPAECFEQSVRLATRPLGPTSLRAELTFATHNDHCWSLPFSAPHSKSQPEAAFRRMTLRLWPICLVSLSLSRLVSVVWPPSVGRASVCVARKRHKRVHFHFPLRHFQAPIGHTTTCPLGALLPLVTVRPVSLCSPPALVCRRFLPTVCVSACPRLS